MPMNFYGSVGYGKPNGFPDYTEYTGGGVTRTKEKGILYLIKVL